jgi:hypothetical protein
MTLTKTTADRGSTPLGSTTLQEKTMETLISISYWICGAGLVLTIAAYFVIPKAIRMALKEEESETEDK